MKITDNSNPAESSSDPPPRASDVAESGPNAWTRKRIAQLALKAVIAVSIVVSLYAMWAAIGLWLSFRSVGRIDVDLDQARVAIANLPDDQRPPPPLPVDLDPVPIVIPPPQQSMTTTTTLGAIPSSVDPADITRIPYDPDFAMSPLIADGVFNTFLVIGSDARAGLGGSRADVIILVLIPQDGAPILVSLPRDLWVSIPCWNTFNRINAALNGCGEAATGPELLAITVAQFTGIEPDHLVLVDFEDFKTVIDAFGGIRICVDNPVRDGVFKLPAGCTNADGGTALGWVRSRHTEELVDGVWRPMRGVNDLTRNTRQRDVLFQLLGKVKSLDALTSLTSIAQSIADAVTIDESLSFSETVGLAWDLRGVSPSEIASVTIPVRNFRTEAGAQVLIPTMSFAQFLAEYWP